MVSVDLTAGTSLHSVDDFKRLVVKQKDGAIVRLEDVATVTLGAENYDFTTAFGGRNSVFIGIKVAPEANVLEVAKRVRDAFPEVQAADADGPQGGNRLRRHQVHPQLDRRGCQDAGAGARDREPP